MIPFRGRIVFKQYIKGKRHTFGIKLFKLCVQDGIIYNFKVYSGKDEHLSDSCCNEACRGPSGCWPYPVYRQLVYKHWQKNC